MIDRTPKPCLHKQVSHRHGTHRAFIADGCRCWECIFAHNEWDRGRRQISRERGPRLVDNETVKQHVRALMADGATLRQIAAEAGVTLPCLSGVMHHSTIKMTLASTAEKILSVQQVPAERLEDMPSDAVVPAVGSRRRVQALMAVGWSQGEIARRAGAAVRTVWELATRDRYGVLVCHHLAFCRVYDDLWDKQPPAHTPWLRTAVTKRRNDAASRAWAPPMAWDDETIDDPDAYPNFDGTPDDARRMGLYLAGLSDVRMAREEGISPESIAKWRRRRGLPSNYKPRGMYAS